MQHARSSLKIRARDALKKWALDLAAISGRYVPFSKSESEYQRAEPIAFRGDLPTSAGTEFNQYRLVYTQPRAPVLWANDIVYTPTGQAWIGSKLHRRFSIREPNLRDLRSPPPRDGLPCLEKATLLQCNLPYTYGDWVSEAALTLAGIEPDGSPLVLPEFLARKSYVRADVKRLGFELVSAEAPLKVLQARVARLTHPINCIPVESVVQFRKRLSIRPPKPRAGSMIYLSRAGEASEVMARQMPYDVIEPVLRKLGAQVIHCRDWRYDDYHRLASEAETVVADLGSATFNLVQWNSSRLVQLYSNSWWDGWGLFIAKAVGITDISMVCVDGVDQATLERKLRELLQPADAIAS